MKKIISSFSFILLVGIVAVSAQNVDRVKAVQSTDKKGNSSRSKGCQPGAGLLFSCYTPLCYLSGRGIGYKKNH